MKPGPLSIDPFITEQSIERQMLDGLGKTKRLMFQKKIRINNRQGLEKTEDFIIQYDVV